MEHILHATGNNNESLTLFKSKVKTRLLDYNDKIDFF